MKVFRVSRSYWEDYEPHDLLGPDECSPEAFHELCNSLLHEAAEEALKIERDNESPSFVGWSEIVERLVILLGKHGFTSIKPIEVVYSGTNIIKENRAYESQLPDSIIKEVTAHNHKVSDRL